MKTTVSAKKRTCKLYVNTSKFVPQAYARRGGERSSLPLSTIGKNENHSFWNDPLYFKQILPKLLSCFSVLSNLLNIIARNFHCDAIIPVVKFFVALRLNQYDRLKKSKCKPGQGQWALLKLEACCDVIK